MRLLKDFDDLQKSYRLKGIENQSLQTIIPMIPGAKVTKVFALRIIPIVFYSIMGNITKNVRERATIIMLIFPRLGTYFMEIGIKICPQKENHSSHYYESYGVNVFSVDKQ